LSDLDRVRRLLIGAEPDDDVHSRASRSHCSFSFAGIGVGEVGMARVV